MAQLIVRNLDDGLVRRLKVRAAAHGCSAEEQYRQILRQALGPPSSGSFKDALLAMPDICEDADFARDDGRGRQVDR